MTSIPKVVVVGRPNVGKSTLVNRIIGRQEAIVQEKPGVTRDRKEVDADWCGQHFTLVDTGGWLEAGDLLDEKVSDQSARAIADADLVLFVVDATVGVTSEDEAMARLVHRCNRPVVLVANKVDNQQREDSIWELLALGLGDPVPVSALHGRGSGELLDAVVDALPVEKTSEADDAAQPSLAASDSDEAAGADDLITSVALVGRPNVGKSTLFNRLIGEERSVVHDLPGTTRDSVDTLVQTPVGSLRFVDTAGMRRRSRIDDQTEYYSLVRTLKSIDRADVALLLIDATEGVTHQDQRLAERVDSAGCPIILVLNKWELLDSEARRSVETQVSRRLHFLGDGHALKISAATGKGVQRILPSLADAMVGYRRRVPTRAVNQLLRAAQQAQPGPGGARILYATQGATDPPTFTLFANKEVPKPYLRYLERRIREEFQLGSTPITLRVRRRD